MDATQIRNALQDVAKSQHPQPTSRPPTRDETIIRQNALGHADAWLAHVLTKDEKNIDDLWIAYIDIAQRCESFVLRIVEEKL